MKQVSEVSPSSGQNVKNQFLELNVVIVFELQNKNK